MGLLPQEEKAVWGVGTFKELNQKNGTTKAAKATIVTNS